MDYKKICKKYEKDVVENLRKWIRIPSVYDETTVSKDKPFGEDVHNALDFIAKKNDGYNDQISKELKYFRDYYADLKPVVLLIYDREAYQSKDLRITFDTNIRYRFNDLNLSTSLEGKPLDEGTIMMEIKTIHAMPLWLVELLSENQIYKSSYSKYGKTYLTKILQGENK